tara:strand:- start:1093 stop:1629 length:537 start_codon:yes stop_codon:yes gene_type:complete
MSKRKSDQIETIPDGFKKLESGKIVSSKYHLISLNKTPIVKSWFANMNDDEVEKKVKIHIDTQHLLKEDLDFIKNVDKTLSESSKLMNKKHFPLLNAEGTQAKFSLYMKFPKRKKQNIIAGDFTVTGNFLLSSVYDYNPDGGQSYYGINLIVPQSQKKPVIATVQKPKTKEENDDDDQ